MYAVFEDGARQYRVSEGDKVRLDYRDAEVGSRFELGRVLLYQGDGLQIGKPTVEGARVLVEVIDQTSVKTYIQKFRRRKGYRRFKGHRQPFTAVQVKSILLAGQEAPKEETVSDSVKSQANPLPSAGQGAPTEEKS